VKQITIVSENRPGVAAEITEALASHGVNIESIDAEGFEHTAVTILSVDKYDIALQALRDLPDINAVSEDAIVIRLKDEPGALAQVARRFKDAGINMRSMRFLQRDGEYGLVAISTERTDDALALVKDLLVS